MNKDKLYDWLFFGIALVTILIATIGLILVMNDSTMMEEESDVCGLCSMSLPETAGVLVIIVLVILVLVIIVSDGFGCIRRGEE